MDATWSVRIPEDMKEKLSAMITESGLNSKDFLTQVIQIYELKTASKLQPVMESDIDELTQLTGRVHNVFINLCERITNFQKQRDEEFSLKFKEKNDMIEVFNGRIKMHEEKLLENEEKVKSLKKGLNESLEQYANLNEACDANKALLSEYREKNETLTGLLDEYKEYKSMIGNIKKDLEKEKSLRQSAELKISEKDKKIEQLNTRLEETKKTCEVELNQRLELCQIQKEKELLVVRKECQQTLESSQKEYVGKIKDLLDMIEKQKSSGTAKKASEKPISNSSKS